MSATGQTSAQYAMKDPDVRLMLRVRDHDDREAFEKLMEQYQHRLLSVLAHVVGSAEAEDLAQEAFLRVYRARLKYRPRAKFSTWLFTIANNLALNKLRSRHRNPMVSLKLQESGSLGGRPEEQMVRDRGHAPHQRLQQQELAGVIQKALEQLNERQRMAVMLNKFEEMCYADIAEVMQLTTKAVKSLLSRARANLRVLLQSYVDVDGEHASEVMGRADHSGDCFDE